MSKQPRLRLFLDSNVLTGGILAQWGLDKAVLSLCAARICRMVLAEYVREEVEENLLTRGAQLSPAAAEQVIEDYDKLLKLARPEVIPLPLAQEVANSRHLIRHAADVPVLLSAIHAQPDWLLTHKRTISRLPSQSELACGLQPRRHSSERSQKKYRDASHHQSGVAADEHAGFTERAGGYPHLSAIIGSTLAARRAGAMLAPRATLRAMPMRLRRSEDR
jgi:hypothetical protein